jgi:fused signal recognition particle receptor
VSLLQKLTAGLAKTRDALFSRVAAIVPGSGRTLTDADYEVLEAALLSADVGPATTDRLLEGVRRRLAGRSAEGDPAQALRAEVESLLAGSERSPAAAPAAALPAAPPAAPPPAPPSRPRVILVVGVNGTGKTTSIAKLAHRLRTEGSSVLLVASDTFRAAAADQLRVWAERASVEIVAAQPGADPASVAHDGMTRAIRRGIDRVIVDTAGRLHVKENLMEEAKKIRRVIERASPGAPQEVLLVLDATTGQNGLRQAEEFHRALGLTGLIVTKLDGTAKGGVVLAIADRIGVPIRWLGVGEGIEDLLPFEPGAFAAALLAG